MTLTHKISNKTDQRNNKGEEEPQTVIAKLKDFMFWHNTHASLAQSQLILIDL